MKNILLFSLLMLTFLFQERVLAQTIKFQYDVKGNQLSAKYTGTNACAVIVPTTANLADANINSPINSKVLIEKTPISEEAFDLKIYPNPSSNEITLDYQLPDSKRDDIIIYNSIGQIVARLNTEGRNRIQYNISSLPQGIYRCVLQSSDDKPVVKTFTKM